MLEPQPRASLPEASDHIGSFVLALWQFNVRDSMWLTCCCVLTVGAGAHRGRRRCVCRGCCSLFLLKCVVHCSSERRGSGRRRWVSGRSGGWQAGRAERIEGEIVEVQVVSSIEEHALIRLSLSKQHGPSRSEIVLVEALFLFGLLRLALGSNACATTRSESREVSTEARNAGSARPALWGMSALSKVGLNSFSASCSFFISLYARASVSRVCQQQIRHVSAPQRQRACEEPYGEEQPQQPRQ